MIEYCKVSLLFLCTMVSFFLFSYAAVRPLSHSLYLQDSRSSFVCKHFLVFPFLSYLTYFWFLSLLFPSQGWMGKVFSVLWAGTLQSIHLVWCKDLVPPPRHAPPAPPHSAQAQGVTLLIARPNPQQAAAAMPWLPPRVPTPLDSPQVSILKSNQNYSFSFVDL